MSDVITLFSARRSIRRYTAAPVADDLLQQLLTAATWAPSAHNRQPWRFAVVRAAETKHRLATAMGDRLRADLTADHAPADVIEKDAARSYQRITGAPLVIVVCLTMADMDTYPDPGRQHKEYLMAAQSTAMAGQNLLLAAHALGLAACWLCAPLFCPDVVRETLALPADWEAQGLVTVGWAGESRVKERKPLESRVRYCDNTSSLPGLFADEPELIDEVMADVASSREKTPWRLDEAAGVTLIILAAELAKSLIHESHPE